MIKNINNKKYSDLIENKILTLSGLINAGIGYCEFSLEEGDIFPALIIFEKLRDEIDEICDII